MLRKILERNRKPVNPSRWSDGPESDRCPWEDWDDIVAIGVIGFVLWEQTKALKMLATALVKLVEIYSGHPLEG